MFNILPATGAASGYRITLRPALVRPTLVDPPTLGEILDLFAGQRPDLRFECDPALRTCPIGGVVVKGIGAVTGAGVPSQRAASEKRPTRRPAQV